MELRTVLVRSDKIKYLIIPKKSEIQAGEKVLIINNLELINKFIEEEIWKQKKKQKK